MTLSSRSSWRRLTCLGGLSIEDIGGSVVGADSVSSVADCRKVSHPKRSEAQKIARGAAGCNDPTHRRPPLRGFQSPFCRVFTTLSGAAGVRSSSPPAQRLSPLLTLALASMAIKIGINGFGRIGRLVFRAILERKAPVRTTSTSSPSTTSPTPRRSPTSSSTTPSTASTPATSASKAATSSSTATGSRCSPSATRAQLPWGDLGAEVVVESTGVFRTREKAGAPPQGRREEGRHLRPRERRASTPPS